MEKPQKLEIGRDYSPALLWLMDRLESARVSDVLAAFEESFRDHIPEEHYEKTQRGHIKWQHYVAWSRFHLVDAGLMGSGGRGVWTVTPDGKDWLGENPDADSFALTAELQRDTAITVWEGILQSINGVYLSLIPNIAQRVTLLRSRLSRMPTSRVIVWVSLYPLWVPWNPMVVAE